MDNAPKTKNRGEALSVAAFVTGGSGLLGEAVARRLSATNRVVASYRHVPANVEVFDDCFGVTDTQSLLRGVPLDLVGEEVHDLLPECDTVIHLAQSHQYKDFPAGASDVFGVNTHATHKLLDAAMKRGAKRFIFASSGSVYHPSDHLLTEKSPLADPWQQGHYAATKRASELLCSAYASKMTIIILRFFFIYGPRQNASMLVPRLIDSVRKERALKLQGQDGFRLNPIFVEDAAEAVIAASRLEASTIVNVAGPEVVTFRQLGEAIGSAVGRKVQFDAVQAIPQHCAADVSHMCRLLTPPATGILAGIKRMVDFTVAG